MRYRPEHKEGTHRDIVNTAAIQFRKFGFNGTGIQKIMRGAGLTVGGFYGHFESKKALLGETINLLLHETSSLIQDGIEELRGVQWLKAVSTRYLSAEHRDDIENGCALPVLTPEVPRAGAECQRIYQDAMLAMIDQMEDRMPEATGMTPRQRAWAFAALCAGGVMISRALKDKDLSDEVLAACRAYAVPELAEANGNSNGNGH